MAIELDVSLDYKQVQRMFRDIPGNIVPRATASALNKSAGRAETVAVRKLSEATGLKQKDVRSYMAKVRATRTKLIATISATGRHLNLIRFGARKVKAGISAAPWKKRRIFKGAFIGNKGRTVFVRDKKLGYMPSRKGQTKHSEKIKPVWGPSVPTEFVRKKVDESMRDIAAQVFPKLFRHEMNWRLRKYK